MQSFKLSAKVLAYILLLICNVDAKRDYSIEVLDLKLTVIPDLCVKNMTSSLTDNRIINVDSVLNQNVNSWVVKVRIDAFPAVGPELKIVDLEVDFCKSLQPSIENSFLQGIVKEVVRTSNWFHGCPLLANKEYYLRNYTIREDDYPAVLPLLKFRIKYEVFFNSKLNAIVLLNGEIKKAKN